METFDYLAPWGGRFEPKNIGKKVVKFKEYPSKSGGKSHVATLYVDGSMTCTHCIGFARQKHCWHTDLFKKGRR